MIWTRKSLMETSGWFNQKPLAPLDETLRIPLALEEIFSLLTREYGVVLKKEPLIIHRGYFYFRPYRDYFFQIGFQPKVYFLLWRILRESKKAKDEWGKSTQKFLKEIDWFKQQDLSKFSNKELLEHIKKIIKLDAYWIFKLGFGLPIIYHYSSEILLKFLYRFLVKDKYPQNYHELLIGYSSKLKEADLAYWEMVGGSLSPDDYLDKYGFRATDVTLVIPTLGEERRVLEKRIHSLQNVVTPDFGKINKKVLEKRRLREKYVSDNFHSRVPFGRVVFDKVLEIAREYISIRETRRFFYTMGTFYIRESLLELGGRVRYLEDPKDIFFLTKEELDKAVLEPESIDKKQLNLQIIERREQWERRNKQIPPEEIKL